MDEKSTEIEEIKEQNNRKVKRKKRMSDLSLTWVALPGVEN